LLLQMQRKLVSAPEVPGRYRPAVPIDPKLAPADAAVALRSLPRRFRALFTGREQDEGPDDLAQRPGADGWTAVGHITAASQVIGLASRALQEVLRSDDPMIDRAVIERSRRVEDPAPGGSVEERLSELGWEADALAENVEGVAAHDWTRTGSVPGHDKPVSALDLVRAAVEAGIDHLKAAEATLAEVRARD
jgi:hypothetical protein